MVRKQLDKHPLSFKTQDTRTETHTSLLEQTRDSKAWTGSNRKRQGDRTQRLSHRQKKQHCCSCDDV